MSRWRIFTPQLVAEDARRPSYVEVEADQMYIGYGGILQFLVREHVEPAMIAEPVGTTGIKIGANPKFKKKLKPKSICIRSFNSGYWADVELIS